MDIEIPQPIVDLAHDLRQAGGRALVVGGYVRDAVMARIRPTMVAPDAADIDVEVFGLAPSVLESILRQHGDVDLVGQSFGVYQVRLADGTDLDVSLPRKDNHHGVGHTALTVDVIPTMSVREAAARRDFRINAMSYDPLTGELLDPFAGYVDIQRGVLRHTSKHFAEDPLRLLRGVQFAARFGFTIAPETAELCHELVFSGALAEVSHSRWWGEWKKFLGRGRDMIRGMKAILDTGLIHALPELAAMVDFPQEPKWHPEGDVWTHTTLVMQRAVDLATWLGLAEDERLVLVGSALCHDLGKPAVLVNGLPMRNDKGQIVSPGHAELGVDPAYRLLAQIGAPHDMRDQIVKLVAYHMAHTGAQPSGRTVRRLAQRLAPASMQHWYLLVTSDASGRHPAPACNPAAEWIAIAYEQACSHEPVKPLIMGRHLIERGVRPGPVMGGILRAAFDAQMDGRFATVDAGMEWITANRLV